MKARAATPSKDRRPTPDELYLAEKLNGESMFEAVRSEHAITIAALQKWNLIYGVDRVTGALRNAWGFPPLEGIDNPFAYVQGILRGGA